MIKILEGENILDIIRVMIKNIIEILVLDIMINVIKFFEGCFFFLFYIRIFYKNNIMIKNNFWDINCVVRGKGVINKSKLVFKC